MLYYLSPASAFLIALGFVLREFETFPFERLDGAFCDQVTRAIYNSCDFLSMCVSSF
jgi:hypothetical protein